MKIRVSVKDYVALSFLVYCSPILVWEELRFRQKWRFRMLSYIAAPAKHLQAIMMLQLNKAASFLAEGNIAEI
jgi:hypothetical protein